MSLVTLRERQSWDNAGDVEMAKAHPAVGDTSIRVTRRLCPNRRQLQSGPGVERGKSLRLARASKG